MTNTLNAILSDRQHRAVQPKAEPRTQVSSLSQEDETMHSLNEKKDRGSWRLSSALENDKPLKDNVPRGYYLNILV